MQLLREDWGEQSLGKHEPQLYRDQGFQVRNQQGEGPVCQEEGPEAQEGDW